MRTSIKKQTIQGVQVESWYHEGYCKWEAWVKGTGTCTDLSSRDGALDSVMALYSSTFCPCCGSLGTMGRIQRDDGGRAHIGLYCLPCGYAQTKRENKEWYCVVGEMAIA